MEGLGVPSKLYNILSSGRPLVAIVYPNSEVARVVAEFDCGVRVDYDKPHLLATTIAELSSSPETLARMGKNARRALEEHFTLDKAAKRFSEVFVEAANSVGSRSAVSTKEQPIQTKSTTINS